MTTVKPLIYRPPMDPFLTILHEDNDIIVLDKQSGLLTVPGKPASHRDCLESRVNAEYGVATIVHRLDMETSGVIIMARTMAAHRHLSKQFEMRQTQKTYIARVFGSVEKEEGSIDLPLICDWPNRPKQVVDHEKGKPALTHYSVIEREKNATRLSLKPITGRSHQLRVHMLSLGHVILGDNLYASGEAHAMAERLQLHAATLALTHPISGAPMSFTAPIPF